MCEFRMSWEKHFVKAYIMIGWFAGWVLWHINHCRLFNAECSLYINIKYIGFGLVGFYGISTIVGYFIPNPLYTLIYKIYRIWFGLVLWHINHCRLFNAKFFYTHIKYMICKSAIRFTEYICVLVDFDVVFWWIGFEGKMDKSTGYILVLVDFDVLFWYIDV